MLRSVVRIRGGVVWSVVGVKVMAGLRFREGWLGPYMGKKKAWGKV